MQKVFWLIILLWKCTFVYSQQDSVSSIATQLVDQQLVAYNAGDTDAFLQPYSDSVAVYNFPNQLVERGKEAMRGSYGQLFKQYPDLHAEVVNRIVQDNVVIDQERATLTAEGEQVELSVIAIYTIKDQKISEVRFIYPAAKE